MKLSSKVAFIGLIAMLFAFSGCGVEHYAQGNFPKKYITFGTYGGPYGDENKKVLLPNGMLFGHTIGDTKYGLITRIERSEAKDLIKQVENCGIKDRVVNKHGENISYFLSLFEGETEYLWVWGSSVTSEPEEVKEIMKRLNALTELPSGK